jgi:hypothetical protein
MNIYNIINDIDIDNGQTKRMNCPNCGGYKTFTVTNNMGSILWNCYKASCNVSGTKKTHLSVDDIMKLRKTAVQSLDKFEMPNYIVPQRDGREFIVWCAKWGIDEKQLNLLYDVKDHRVVFPIVHNGVIVDAIGRGIRYILPKWKRYGKSDLPYVTGCGNVAVVVEDCVSAAVVGDMGFVGVAVLGTSLSESHKTYLSRFSTAIIALDPDASPNTLQIAKELRGHVDTVKVLRLQDDIKYRNPEDLDGLSNIGEM